MTGDRLELTLQHYATKADLAEAEKRLATDLNNAETRLIKWMISIVGAGIMLLLTVLPLMAVGFLHLTGRLGHGAPAPQALPDGALHRAAYLADSCPPAGRG